MEVGETVELIHHVEIKEAVDETQATEAVKASRLGRQILICELAWTPRIFVFLGGMH